MWSLRLQVLFVICFLAVNIHCDDSGEDSGEKGEKKGKMDPAKLFPDCKPDSIKAAFKACKSGMNKTSEKAAWKQNLSDCCKEVYSATPDECSGDMKGKAFDMKDANSKGFSKCMMNKLNLLKDGAPDSDAITKFVEGKSGKEGVDLYTACMAEDPKEKDDSEYAAINKACFCKASSIMKANFQKIKTCVTGKCEKN